MSWLVTEKEMSSSVGEQGEGKKVVANRMLVMRRCGVQAEDMGNEIHGMVKETGKRHPSQG